MFCTCSFQVIALLRYMHIYYLNTFLIRDVIFILGKTTNNIIIRKVIWWVANIKFELCYNTLFYCDFGFTPLFILYVNWKYIYIYVYKYVELGDALFVLGRLSILYLFNFFGSLIVLYLKFSLFTCSQNLFYVCNFFNGKQRMMIVVISTY